uniref:tRNA-splicing endonuclease subunit Sen15 domain-containing protein n=1 Tax=Peronospora matthiolae TaxID=2874970 RepID=A0AAV1V3S3_9STRA
MDVNRLPPATREVLNDLLVERGLTEWRVVSDVRVSTNRIETVDVIYGNVITSRLEEERIDQRRKRKAEQVLHVTQKSTWSGFVVLPAVSSIPTLSVKGLLELQQCVDVNHPSDVTCTTKRTFLCLTDAANVSYYVLQTPAILPS